MSILKKDSKYKKGLIEAHNFTLLNYALIVVKEN